AVVPRLELAAPARQRRRKLERRRRAQQPRALERVHRRLERGAGRELDPAIAVEAGRVGHEEEPVDGGRAEQTQHDRSENEAFEELHLGFVSEILPEGERRAHVRRIVAVPVRRPPSIIPPHPTARLGWAVRVSGLACPAASLNAPVTAIMAALSTE